MWVYTTLQMLTQSRECRYLLHGVSLHVGLHYTVDVDTVTIMSPSFTWRVSSHVCLHYTTDVDTVTRMSPSFTWRVSSHVGFYVTSNVGIYVV